MMRKLDLMGYDNMSLKWLRDYLTGRSQYVVAEATNGCRFGMLVGTPQDCALGPTLWRQYTNDLPECVKGGRSDTQPDEGRRSIERSRSGEWTLSHWVDSVDTKPHQGQEEEHDRHLREVGEMTVGERLGGKQDPVRLYYKAGKMEGGGDYILFADDT